MKLNKIKIDSELTTKLRTLKSRTGLAPNILCRIGFCLSLNEPGIPDTQRYIEDGMEFNRYTLTGEWDSLFIALLKERCLQDKINVETQLPDQFLAHLNRGISLIYTRVKSITGLQNLFSINP
ncbi:MAG: DNA sulfur modification protein DndE [Deltaproteobacteria bacterium]|nr:DNA sulfur modification protein DndE [Deltaproteobacteria bacterium]